MYVYMSAYVYILTIMLRISYLTYHRFSDPFASLVSQDAYLKTCGYVMNMHKQQSTDQVLEWSFYTSKTVKNWSDRVQVLAAAVFTQLSMNNIDIDDAFMVKFIQWLKDDYNTAKHGAGTSVNLDLYTRFFFYLFRTLPSIRRVSVSTSLAADIVQSHLKLHISLLALSPLSGWLHTLYTDPVSCKGAFIPGMVDSEEASFVNVVDARGNQMQAVGW